MRNEKKYFLLFLLLLVALSFYLLGNEALGIPYLILRSFIRMIGGYVLSIIFSIPLVVLIMHNKKSFAIIFPIVDILQSVPILGFLPFAILFLIKVIPVFGTEVTAMFLIFTSMTWAIVFNSIEGIKAIPNDIRDSSRILGLTGSDYLFQVIFPAIYGPFISGSITAWGGAWYFLFASEYITFGKSAPYVLPGIGSFIAQYAYAGNIFVSILGILILAAMVLFMNLFVWRPLLARANRFSLNQNNMFEDQEPQDNIITKFVYSLYGKIRIFSGSVLNGFLLPTMTKLGITPAATFEERKKITIYDYIVLFAIPVLFIVIFIASKNTIGYLFTLLSDTFYTLIRLIIAYIIALVIALAIAIYVGRNKKVVKTLIPIFDVAQSIPAIAIFPIIVVTVINFVGGGYGIQIASVILLLTGMLWYMVFNLIRAMQSVPSDILEVDKLMQLKFSNELKDVLLPALFPTIILASLQSMAGGWNATIISEYITYQGQTFSTPGLGFLLDSASTSGNVAALALSLLTMILVIVILNKIIWRRLLRYSELFKF